VATSYLLNIVSFKHGNYRILLNYRIPLKYTWIMTWKSHPEHFSINTYACIKCTLLSSETIEFDWRARIRIATMQFCQTTMKIGFTQGVWPSSSQAWGGRWLTQPYSHLTKTSDYILDDSSPMRPSRGSMSFSEVITYIDLAKWGQ